jgi:beta-galactosidase/beta-glucuronidase
VTASPRRTLLAVAGACAALAAAPAAAQAPAGPAPTSGGPGGRTALSTWTMRLDAANRGLSRGWQRGNFSGQSVSVPSVVNPGDIKGARGWRNYEGSVAWYRTTFAAPSPGLYALSFASANWQADVWVDGRPLTRHRGSYLPFEARASLAAGTHTVVVRIDWRNPTAQSRIGFHRTWFNWGGINGEVSVRAIGQSELIDPTIQTTLQPEAPNAAQATVRVSVEVHNNGPTRVIAPEGTLSREGQAIALPFPPATIGAGQTATESATVTVAHPALWAPGSPNMYELSLAVGQESSFSARVGLRQLTRRAGRLFLNGRRLLVHGASLQEDARGHGDALTGADEDALVAELKAIKANAVRAQHPLDAGLLDRLDGAGILVWQGIGPVEGAGNWYSSSPALLAAAEAQATTAARAEELHPSIFAWNLVDEVAGNGHSPAEVRYVRSVAAWLHAHDPTRIVAVDVWGDHPPKVPGPLYAAVDAIAETDYTGWYHMPQDSPAAQRAEMRKRLRAMERTFVGKVLLISEFGAESNTLNPTHAPGGYAFQANLLARHIAVYAKDPKLTGMLIWDLRDYPLIPAYSGGSIHFKLPHVRLIEGMLQKGLFAYSGARKPAVAVVSRLFGALP